jgi:integrase
MKPVKKCRHVRAGDPPERCSCAYYVSTYAAGRRQYVNVGKDQKAAQIAAARMVVDKLEQKPVSRRVTPEGATVDDLATAWLDALKAERRKASTIDSYRQQIRTAREYFHTAPVASLSARHTRDYAEWLRDSYARNTAVTHWHALTGLLKWALDQELIPALPLPAKPPRFGPRPSRDVAEVEVLDSAIEALHLVDPFYASLAEFLYLTGLRIGEALALTPESVEGHYLKVGGTRRNGAVGPPKTRRSIRKVVLSPRAAEILAERVEDLAGEDTVFLWPRTYKACQSFLVRQGAPFRWHDLRHANTYLRHKAGEDLRVSQAQLGHGSLAVTLGYGWHDESPDLGVALDAARGTPQT